MLIDFIGNEVYDVIITGQGIAGLSTAYYLPENLKVLILSKASQEASNTWMAQGGVAASISKFDSPENHYQDTISAGDGLCDESVARIVVYEGRERIVEMIQLGVPFERIDDEFALAKEGGHSFARVLHFEDRTGKAIVSTLRNYLETKPNITFLEGFFVEQIITSGERAAGVYGHFLNSKKKGAILGRSVVIATGGACQIYERTTNPPTATGDGIAAGFRAGAFIRDMEFVQFHPTVLNDGRSPMLLITEAARGLGAKLLTPEGKPLMEGHHPLGDLAPRFVVVKKMAEEMLEKGFKYFLLDMRHFTEKDMKHISFIASELKKRGFDISKDLIPVIPAAHYFIGGLKTDLYGRTNIPGLYACGEASATGLHGANRLASNSLLEGLVFGKRIADSIRSEKPVRIEVLKKNLGFTAEPKNPISCEEAEKKIKELKSSMDEKAGIVRIENGLEEMLDDLDSFYEDSLNFTGVDKCVSEFLNLVLVSRWVVKMAKERKESRGTHLRLDYPKRDDKNFRFHQEAGRYER